MRKPNEKIKVTETQTTTQATTENPGLNLFSLLPKELIDLITPYLNGCRLEILNAPARDDQKKQVVDIQFDKKLNKNIAVLNAYHLIMVNGAYQLGFCGANNQYQTKPLDAKGPLKRYIANHANDLRPGISQDVELLKLVESEIKEAKGQINPARKDLGSITDALNFGIQQRLQVIGQEIATQAEKTSYLPNNFFKVNEKPQAFDALLVHVERGEEDEARQILEKYPDLLLWECEGDMKRPDHSSRTFKNVSAFKLALWAGDWHMWEMMLRVIPENQKTYYCNELLKKYDDLKKNGLQYTLNNLTLCGLRIIQGTPTQEQQDHAKRFNAYHLIIAANGSYSLGSYDQTTEAYVQKPLGDDSELKKYVKPDAANPATLTRDSVILELTERELIKMGALVHVSTCESRFNLRLLIDAIKVYVDNFDRWHSQNRFDLLRYQWSMVVGMLQRFLPPQVLHECLRRDRSFDPKPTFNEKDKLPRSDKDWVNLLPLPLLDELGSSSGYFRAGARPAWTCRAPGRFWIAPLDFDALSELDKTRTVQFENLREQLVQCNLPSLDSASNPHESR